MSSQVSSRDRNSESTSSSLIARVKADDPDAWHRLVDLYGPLIYYWCRQAGLEANDAADVAQEVFRALAIHIAGFQKTDPSHTFRGWLWTIARNKIRDHFRARKSQPQAAGGTDAQRLLLEVGGDFPVGASGMSGESAALRSMLQRALDRVRGDFSEQTWDAFSQTVFAGRTSFEVAAELGTTPNAVRKAKARVLRRLREELGELD